MPPSPIRSESRKRVASEARRCANAAPGTCSSTMDCSLLPRLLTRAARAMANRPSRMNSTNSVRADNHKLFLGLPPADGPRPGARTTANPHRGYQHGVAPDERPGFDLGGMLLAAVEVAGDRACSNIDIFADRGVPQVGEVPHLHPRAQRAVLDLAEVAHVHAPPQAGSRPQPGIGTDLHFLRQFRDLQRRDR